MAEEGEKKFEQISFLREGNYLLIDGFVCQIREIERSKPGKHGAAKARITGIGVFDDQKRTLMKSTGADHEVPIVNRGSAQVVAVMGDVIQIMDTASYETFDVPKPKDISGLTGGAEVEYLRYGSSIRVIRKK